MARDEKLCIDVAKKYYQLRSSLDTLKDARKEKDGVVLGYASGKLGEANEAYQFLLTLSPTIRDGLDVEGLERELLEFNNIHIQL